MRNFVFLIFLINKKYPLFNLTVVAFLTARLLHNSGQTRTTTVRSLRKTGFRFSKQPTLKFQCKLHTSITSKLARFPIYSRKDVEKVFNERDKDLNGKLSWEEFCGEKTKNEKAFSLMDIDKSGKVSKEVERAEA